LNNLVTKFHDKNFPKVYIIILNYNGWNDTIECLETVFRNDYPNFQVIVVDNGSEDNSLDYLKLWANGELKSNASSDVYLQILSSKPVLKNLSYTLITRQNKDYRQLNDPNTSTSKISEANDSESIIFIHSPENLGFSGGNNLGIRYALLRNDFEFIWLLNNDTVVEKNALLELVEKSLSDENIGIVGSKLMLYNDPSRTQAFGGSLNRRWGIFRFITSETELNKLGYIVAASAIISRKCIETTGCFDEAYFLYSEDCDYSLDAINKGFIITVAPNSIVYHKDGKSSVTLYKDYYGIRNNLYFNYKHLKKNLITANLYVLLRILKRLAKFQIKSFYITIKAVFDFYQGKMGRQL